MTVTAPSLVPRALRVSPRALPSFIHLCSCHEVEEGGMLSFCSLPSVSHSARWQERCRDTQR